MNSQRRARTFALLGISGSGKGTQAKRLLRVLPRPVDISTGGGLRQIARRRNLTGRYIKDVLDRGGIAPLWSVAYLWLSAFIEKLEGDESLVIDGAPRRIEEARLMDAFMSDVGRAPPVTIYIRLSPREARRRLLKRGRSDDNPRAIAGRFDFFRRHVMRVIRYYRRRRRLIVVNGDQSELAVWRDIKRTLRLR